MADEVKEQVEQATAPPTEQGSVAPAASAPEQAGEAAQAAPPAETAADVVAPAVATDSPAEPQGTMPGAPEAALEGDLAQELAAAVAAEQAAAEPVAPPELEVTEEVRRILRLEVPVIVKLAGKKMPLGEIIDLVPGSIVEFVKSADTPLELLVNNKSIGHGVAVKVGEKFGLRIDEISPVEETIRKLGD